MAKRKKRSYRSSAQKPVSELGESQVQQELLREGRLRNHYLRKLNRYFRGILLLLIILLAVFAGYIVFAVQTLGQGMIS